MDFYYVLYCSEDGDVHLERFTKQRLEKALADEDWGPDVKIHLCSEIPRRLESAVGIFIIKGQSIVPQPKTVVTAWELK